MEPSDRSPATGKGRTTRALAIADLPVALELRVSARTRRLTLRVEPARGIIQVVVPPGISETEVRRFVERHDAWVRGRLAALPQQIPFADGTVIPILGIDHVIRHDPSWRGPARREDGAIRFGGHPEFLSRRVHDWLVAQARKQLAERARQKAAQIGARVAAVTVRDTTSRWGSCSAQGRLSFSWRLLLAPEPVFDYVVAHEVAHLKELNHSARFWAICAGLTADVPGPRAWLKANGPRLLRYG